MPDYRAVALQKEHQYGLGDWFLRQIGRESGFDPNARSSAGALGIAQFIPSTARAYGLTNPFDPVAALDAAARYDRDLLNRYGSVPRALSAYNSGKPDAYKDPNFAHGQTFNYVKSILGGKTPSTPAAGGLDQALAHVAAPKASPAASLDPLLLGMFANNASTVGVQSLAPLLAFALAGEPGSSAPGDPVAASRTQQSPTPGAPASATWLAPGAKIIGEPYQGTHTVGNWQSDNAIDIAVPVGTPIYAPVSGRLGHTGLLPGEGASGGGRFSGDRVNLFGGNNGFYFAHLSKLAPGVREGATVKKGQLLGYTGAANGVAHLHFGVQHGDPGHYYR